MPLLWLCYIAFAAASDATRQCGITGISRGGPDLTVPPGTARGEVWRYGSGVLLQIRPDTVGLLCNIRREGTPYGDFEIGTDLILFDQMDRIDLQDTIAISRSAREPHFTTAEPSIIAKYPVIGGFVPRGAKLANGSPHPHAGTGFGICEVCPYPADFSERFPAPAQIPYRLEIHQFRDDGKHFSASKPQRLDGWQVGDKWKIMAPGLSPAIPDGEDLLLAVTCTKSDTAKVAGVVHCYYKNGKWQPCKFFPVTGATETWFEPTLIRDADGSLLFSARGGQTRGKGDIPLWRSSDSGRHWQLMFRMKAARTGTPLVLNQAADGTAYFATSTLLGSDRRVLEIVLINDARTALDRPLVVRDSHAEFGQPPGSDRWKVDHGIGAVVRFADGRWHSILVYRVLDEGENYGKPPTPHTGCYVEEVFCKGSPTPTWRF